MAAPQNALINLQDDWRTRPYNTGVAAHNDSIATFILYADKAGTGTKTFSEINYLTNLTGQVQELVSEAISSNVNGIPDVPQGKIAMLSLDNKNPYYGVFNNFSVTGMLESHDQISKIHMNFGAKWNLFLFGNTPNVYRLTGVFLDTKDYPYYQEFMMAYETYLAGRQAVNNNMQLKLVISGQIIDGFLLSATVNHNATTQELKEFSLTFLVKSTQWIRSNLIPKNASERISFAQVEYIEVMNGITNVHRITPQIQTGLSEAKTSETNDGKAAAMTPVTGTNSIPTTAPQG
jgi:hypothetical protein